MQFVKNEPAVNVVLGKKKNPMIKRNQQRSKFDSRFDFYFAKQR